MQLSIGFAKDDRAQSEIGAGDDSQRHRRPKQQRAPRPKPGDDTDDDQRAEGVVRTDASIRDNWKVRLRFANEIDAGNAESEAGYDVHQVMLISKERRKTDEDEPEIRGRAQNSASMPVIELSQNRSKSDVERWKEVVGQVHSAEPIESDSKPPTGMRALKGETQRKKKETDSGNTDGDDDAFGQCGQFPRVAAKEWRPDKEEVDRHVGHDHEWHERDKPS